MDHSYFVYVLTNKPDGVLYVGVTNDILRRVREHKERKGSSFTKKYGLDVLVYYEQFQYIGQAIQREKQIKAGSRKKKLELIACKNPEWRDLYFDIM